MLDGEVFLLVTFRMSQAPDDEWMAVDKSTVALYALEDEAEPLFRYDYQRGGNPPEAHVQVHGVSTALGRLASITDLPNVRKQGLASFHLPVGHARRFRPAVEDVIELLVTHSIVPPVRQGWRDVLEASRESFHRSQLKAAIRRDPEAARQALSASGYARMERSHEGDGPSRARVASHLLDAISAIDDASEAAVGMAQRVLEDLFTMGAVRVAQDDDAVEVDIQPLAEGALLLLHTMLARLSLSADRDAVIHDLREALVQ